MTSAAASPQAQSVDDPKETLSVDETPTPASREVKPYVFGAAKQFSDEKTRLYQEASNQLAVYADRAIRDWVVGFSVESDPLTQFGPGQRLIDEEDNFDITPLASNMTTCGLIATENSLGLALVSGTLGGSPRADVEARALTSIDVRVLDLILKAVLDAASTVLMMDEVSVVRTRDSVLVVADDNRSGAHIGFNLRIQSPRGSGVLTIGLHPETLEALSDAIDQRLSGRKRNAPTAASPATAKALQPVPVHLCVGVGRAKLTAREVVELQEGDVIRTRVPVDSQLVATAGGTDLFKVQIGQHGDHLVAEIVETFGAEDQR